MSPYEPPNNPIPIWSILRKIPPVIYILGIIVIFYANFHANFFQLLNADEMANIQQTYLMANGYTVFRDFYSSYSPVLHAFLLPIFAFIRPSWDIIIASREIMFIFFILRILATLLFVKKLFGKMTSLFLLPLIFFDIVYTFPSIQVRPDNLMLTFHIFGLLFLAYAFNKYSKLLFFMSGVFFSLAFLTCIKIAPSIIVIYMLFFLYALKNKKIVSFLHLLSGFILPIFAFLLFFALQGTLREMLQNVLIDSRAIVDSIAWPVMIAYYLEPHEIIFGTRNINWIYTWALFFLAGAGSYQIIFSALKKEINKSELVLKLIIPLSYIVQLVAIMYVHSVFIQYYLPVDFFSTMLAAVCIYQIYSMIKSIPELKKITVITAVSLFILFTYSTYKTDMYRSKYSLEITKAGFMRNWSQIPEGAYVFPNNVLFRPPAHPIIMGYFLGDFPDKLLKRFPPFQQSLEEKKVPYLLFSQEYFAFLKEDTRSYIESHYKRVQGDGELWTRNPEK